MTNVAELKTLFPPRRNGHKFMVKAIPVAEWEYCGDNQPVSNDAVYCCSFCKGNRRMKSQFKPFCEECGAFMANTEKT